MRVRVRALVVALVLLLLCVSRLQPRVRVCVSVWLNLLSLPKETNRRVPHSHAFRVLLNLELASRKS